MEYQRTMLIHNHMKGVATFLDAGCTVSTPIISICVCFYWVMVGVKYCYLFQDSVRYQYVGRCAAGLNRLEQYFSVSPPYFDLSGTNEVDQAATKMKR